MQVLVGQLLAVHLLDAVGQQTPVEPDEVLLGKLADEGGDVLVLDVGIGVVLRSGGGIRSIAVRSEEIELLARLPILGMLLPVEDVALGHGETALGHQSHLHLVLDLLDGHAVGNMDAAQDSRQIVVGGITADGEESLAHGSFDLLDRKRLAFPVALDDSEFGNSHNYIIYILLFLRKRGLRPDQEPDASSKRIAARGTAARARGRWRIAPCKGITPPRQAFSPGTVQANATSCPAYRKRPVCFSKITSGPPPLSRGRRRQPARQVF